jgi:hypothetical protein
LRFGLGIFTSPSSALSAEITTVEAEDIDVAAELSEASEPRRPALLAALLPVLEDETVATDPRRPGEPRCWRGVDAPLEATDATEPRRPKRACKCPYLTAKLVALEEMDSTEPRLENGS